MKKPKEYEYISFVAYARALEEYCKYIENLIALVPNQPKEQ